MGPKKDQEAIAAEGIRTLCILMETATVFEPDLEAAAAGIGIAQARNLTRKINSIIEHVEYTMSKRKIIKLDPASVFTDSAEPVATAKSATAKDKTLPKAVNKNATSRKPLAKKVTVEKESSEEETSEEEVEDDEGTEEEDGDDDEEEHNSSEQDTD